MLLTTFFLLFVSLSNAINPVSEFDINSYLGHWYQIYTNSFNEITFENSAYCATADYGVNRNGTLSVLNKARIGSVTGHPYSISGWGKKAINANYQGELSVSLQGAPLMAPYWIYSLSSINTDNKLYDYAIVSDPFQFTLFVLARNVTNFYNQYNDEVLEYLQINGWNTTLNSPIKIIHESCIYF